MTATTRSAGPRAKTSAVKPFRLSHGTLEVRDLARSRKFYEEFLGLDCVRHNKPAMLIRKGGYWCVVCIEVGDSVHPQHIMNHWGVDVAARDEVDEAYAKAQELKDEFEIKSITKPGDQHGVYSFYLQDRDSNWWEIQHCDPALHDKQYDRGDVYPPV